MGQSTIEADATQNIHIFNVSLKCFCTDYDYLQAVSTGRKHNLQKLSLQTQNRIVKYTLGDDIIIHTTGASGILCPDVYKMLKSKKSM